MRTLHAVHRRFGLNAPFRIARGTKTAADVVEVTLRQGAHTGRGEGVPYPRYGESVAGALAQVAAVAPLVEGGASRPELMDAMPPGAARNALDCALWDLEARLAGASVAALAGIAAARPTPSAITIGIDAPGAVASGAARIAHVPLLKLKVTRDDAAHQIAALRAAAPAPRLIVDPNESWTAAELVRYRAALIEHRVDLLEQPLPADDDAALADWDAPVPVCADEALHTRADLPRLRGGYTHVNVKLDKTGGLTEALALVTAAKAQGFGVMLGCMVSSSLSIAPALLVAATLPADAFVDLDGPLWLAQDRAGGVVDRGGVLMPPAPGFWGGA